MLHCPASIVALQWRRLLPPFPSLLAFLSFFLIFLQGLEDDLFFPLPCPAFLPFCSFSSSLLVSHLKPSYLPFSLSACSLRLLPCLSPPWLVSFLPSPALPLLGSEGPPRKVRRLWMCRPHHVGHRIQPVTLPILSPFSQWRPRVVKRFAPGCK